jgi:hypothetical protein
MSESDPAQANYYAGRSKLEVGDLDGAIDCLEASITELPHFKSLELLGEAWLRKGEPKRAIVPLAAATTLNGQVRAPSLLAEALLGLGEDLRAHEIASLALSRDANNKKARRVFEATEESYKRHHAPQFPPHAG